MHPVPQIDSTQHIAIDIPISELGNYVVSSRVLGVGATSRVVEGVCKNDPSCKVAVKIIPKAHLETETRKRDLQNEVAVLKKLRHPNIVALLDYYETEHYHFLVFEFVPMDLFDLILREKRLSIQRARDIFRQLLKAVSFLHSNNIVHRDLKPEVRATALLSSNHSLTENFHRTSFLRINCKSS